MYSILDGREGWYDGTDCDNKAAGRGETTTHESPPALPSNALVWLPAS
jgi:hypothetical protein